MNAHDPHQPHPPQPHPTQPHLDHVHAPEHARALERRRRGIAARLWCWWHSGPGGATGQAGQSTVEYALVLLGAAAVALALVAWVTRSDAVQRLFDAVVSRILSQTG